MHVHNIGMSDKKKDYEFSAGCKQTNIIDIDKQATFMGFKRKNGRSGTRNWKTKGVFRKTRNIKNFF